MDLSGYDPLDEKWRWCYYCKADCWPEPDNQRHASDCPTVTGLYPVTEQDEDPWIKGTYGACCACLRPFALGDRYVLIDVDTNRPATSPTRSEVTCVGCAAVAMVAT